MSDKTNDIHVHTQAKGMCKSCGKTGTQYFISTKGKRKGEKFVDHSFYYKVFQEVNWFRGDDELLGTWCRDCFKAKKYRES